MHLVRFFPLPTMKRHYMPKNVLPKGNVAKVFSVKSTFIDLPLKTGSVTNSMYTYKEKHVEVNQGTRSALHNFAKIFEGKTTRKTKVAATRYFLDESAIAKKIK